MKSYLLAALFLLTATTFTHAAGSVNFPGIENGTVTKKSQMNFEELPQAVIKTLDGARFTGWKPVVAYKIQSEDSKYYEVTFVRGDETETLKLNEDGGKIG